MKTFAGALNDVFHKFGLWVLISLAVGGYVGLTAAKSSYNERMTEVIQVGGFLHQGKVYVVTPKP